MPEASVTHAVESAKQLDDAIVKAASLSNAVVNASFFGMHYSSATYKPWPAVNFQTLRTLGQWPGVGWANLNPSNGVFNWASLDAVVNASTSRGVDIIYSFYDVPPWASSGPGTCPSGVPVGSCDKPDLTAWKNFVTQITARYKGKIKYWELWNEPNSPNTGPGTVDEQIAMAAIAYPVIKATGGTVLSPTPQGMNAYQWLDNYFAAGGTAFTDIVSFHGYIDGPPEQIVTLVNNVKLTMSKHGLSALPLWDTEHSWGDSSWPFGATQDEQSAWLARYMVLSFTTGIARSIWYMYDEQHWGTLADQATEQMLEPGIAYQHIYKWMLGATMNSCTSSGNVYQCRLTRAGSYEAIIVWNVQTMDSQTARFTPPKGYTQHQTLDGKTVSIAAGAQVSVGMEPILIEKLR